MVVIPTLLVVVAREEHVIVLLPRFTVKVPFATAPIFSAVHVIELFPVENVVRFVIPVLLIVNPAHDKVPPSAIVGVFPAADSRRVIVPVPVYVIAGIVIVPFVAPRSDIAAVPFSVTPAPIVKTVMAAVGVNTITMFIVKVELAPNVSSVPAPVMPDSCVPEFVTIAEAPRVKDKYVMFLSSSITIAVVPFIVSAHDVAVTVPTPLPTWNVALAPLQVMALP